MPSDGGGNPPALLALVLEASSAISVLGRLVAGGPPTRSWGPCGLRTWPHESVSQTEVRSCRAPEGPRTQRRLPLDRLRAGGGPICCLPAPSDRRPIKKVVEAGAIARREEVAAMRSQANTAELLDDNTKRFLATAAD